MVVMIDEAICLKDNYFRSSRVCFRGGALRTGPEAPIMNGFSSVFPL